VRIFWIVVLSSGCIFVPETKRPSETIVVTRVPEPSAAAGGSLRFVALCRAVVSTNEQLDDDDRRLRRLGDRYDFTSTVGRAHKAWHNAAVTRLRDDIELRRDRLMTLEGALARGRAEAEVACSRNDGAACAAIRACPPPER